MKNRFSVETVTNIDATPAQVWEALTTPALIKKYLMGANVFSDWKVGSTITYTGEFQGKKYQDKGVIQKVEPEKILQSTFFSPLSGKEDTPDNYYLVTYILSKSDGKTMVTLLQDNISTEKERVHSIENWKSVLRKLKAVVESETA